MKAHLPTSHSSVRSHAEILGGPTFRKGLLRSLPITVGYFPIALAFGMGAREVGLPGWVAILMSATTFGGASQMVALSMIASGQSLAAILFAVFVVNSRFFLLAMGVVENIAHWPMARKLTFGLLMTDEAFAVLKAAHGNSRRRFRSMECLGLVTGPVLSWVGATAAGYWAAERLPAVKELGLDFALVALLLGVLSCQVSNRFQFAVAVAAALLSTAWTLAGQSTLAILISALIAPLVGVAWERVSVSRRAIAKQNEIVVEVLHE